MNIAIRVDASLRIGSGHVLRCLTLATTMRSAGATVVFVCREHRENLFNQIRMHGFSVLSLPLIESDDPLDGRGSEPEQISLLMEDYEADANQTIDAIERWGEIDWVVVDHYALDVRWEKKMRKVAAHLMVIDDLANRMHDCDLLLDQSYILEMETRYEGRIPAHCMKLIGPSFALLRPEFIRARKVLGGRRNVVRRVLVFFGGMDLTNETEKAIYALKKTRQSGVKVDVVVGVENPHRDEISALCAAFPSFYYHCQVGNMAELMSSADLSIGAGGGTMWERCSVGLPSIVISVAENQRKNCEAVAQAGGILYLGDSEVVSIELLSSALEVACSSPYLLASIGETGWALVDGHGVDRVVGVIIKRPIDLRRAAEDDCEQIYNWRNSEEVRSFSGDSAVIPYDKHIQWYKNILVDSNRIILIGELAGEAVGVLRYDRDGERSTVSVYLVPGKHGRGIGTELIERGTLWVVENWSDVRIIDAKINAENLASILAFKKAGFSKCLCWYSKLIES